MASDGPYGLAPSGQRNPGCRQLARAPAPALPPLHVAWHTRRVTGFTSPCRCLTPVGFAVIGLVVLAAGAGEVGFGITGKGLELTIAAVLYAVASAILLLSQRPSRPLTVVFLLLVAAAATAAVHHGDPNVPAVGLYLVMAVAALRLDLRSAVAVAAAATLAFDVELLVDHVDPVVVVLALDGGCALFFFLGLLARREHEQRTRVDRLIVQLEQSRAAERSAAVAAERSRLAREMHDVLAHTLSGLAVQLGGTKLLAEHRRDVELAEAVARAQALARDGLAEAREVIAMLRGSTLPGPEAIKDLVEQQRHLGGSCELTVSGQPAPLGPDARLAIYRTAQEALNNVRKHAPSADVALQLTWRADGVRLLVEDSGCGSAPPAEAPFSGYGLAGLAERAALLGGRFSAGPAGDGFRVELHVPAARNP